VRLCIPLSLLGNNSVKTFLRQRKIVGGVVFNAVHVVSKESMRVVLPRTSCFISSSAELSNYLYIITSVILLFLVVFKILALTVNRVKFLKLFWWVIIFFSLWFLNLCLVCNIGFRCFSASYVVPSFRRPKSTLRQWNSFNIRRG
jgi:hypothetical protein